MGMAASQARLLCITARIHDVEYQAQSIQNAKVQLATQQDDAYREYNLALDASTLTINAIDELSGEKSKIPATFNNLCSSGRLLGADGKNYALLDKKGRLIVEEAIENNYKNFSDPYEFAMYMIDGNAIGNLELNFGDELHATEEASFESLKNDNESLNKLHERILNLLNEVSTPDGIHDTTDIYDTNTLKSNGTKEQKAEYEKLLKQYRSLLYKKDAANIMAAATQNDIYKEEFNSAKFDYYVEIFKQIKEAGGCVSIEDYNGMHGDAANDSEWLQAMVESGQITVAVIEKDLKTGDVDLDETAISSDISLEYTPTVQVDSRAQVKAQAEYEHKLRQIDKKDKAFDLDLSKLETERSALTTEYESVKKVIQDNIDRTFGIFS